MSVPPGNGIARSNRLEPAGTNEANARPGQTRQGQVAMKRVFFWSLLIIAVAWFTVLRMRSVHRAHHRDVMGSPSHWAQGGRGVGAFPPRVQAPSILHGPRNTRGIRQVGTE